MRLLIFIDRPSQYSRNKGLNIPFRFEKRPKTVFSNALGIPCQTALPFSDRFVKTIAESFEDDRQKELGPVFRTGCRPFLRVSGT
jgi:hypothetical protein